MKEIFSHQSIFFFRCKNQRLQDLVIDLRKQKTKDNQRIILTWKWRKLYQLQKNKRSTIQHCDNSRNLNACRWRRLCQMRWWIRKQCLLFIELIQFRAEDEDETESENENENENENDENEDKQYRNRFSINIKTDDAKSKDVVNRLHFMKLKKLKKKPFLLKRKVFFSDANSIISDACSNRDRRRLSYLIWLANVNVIERWCHFNRKVMLFWSRWCQSVNTLNKLLSTYFSKKRSYKCDIRRNKKN